MAHTVNNIVTQIPSGGQRALCPQGSLVLRHAFERLLTKERCMLLWGQSVPVALPPFPQKSAVICGKELVKGIARLLHMELFPVKVATGDVDTDLDAKTEAALRAAERCPFVLLHINGADEAAHRHDSAEKETFLCRVMIGCSPGCWRLSMRLWWPPTTELIRKAEPIWVAHSLFLPAFKW